MSAPAALQTDGLENLPGRHLGPQGKYRLLHILARGGMATVFEAEQSGLSQRLAIKIASPLLTRQPRFAERFRREAEAGVRLVNGPHILPVYDVGDEDGLLYLVLPLITGGTLKDRIEHESGQPWTLSQALLLAEQVLRALSFAHGQCIVHRDVKPSNILLDGDGAFLADFGIAKALQESVEGSLAGASLTGATLIGTPAYMAPEQALGLPVDARADLYAFGVVLYQLLTGRVPYEARTPLQVAFKHVQAALPPPRELNPALSVSMETVLRRALAREPEARFSSADEFLSALRGASSNEDIRLETQVSHPRSEFETELSQRLERVKTGRVHRVKQELPPKEVTVSRTEHTGWRIMMSPQVRRRAVLAGVVTAAGIDVAAALGGVAAGRLSQQNQGRALPAPPVASSRAGSLTTLTPIPRMNSARGGHTASVLLDGRVLVTGGQTGEDRHTAEAELYDPATNRWTATGLMANVRSGHTATLLPRGHVLVTGGQGTADSFPSAAERYDPSTGRWLAAGTLAQGRIGHTATRLSNGQVLVVGGQNNNAFIDTAERFDPATGTWLPAGTLAGVRSGHTGTVLSGGDVLVAGGFAATTILAMGERFDVRATRWLPVGSLLTGRLGHAASLLPNGHVLITGGYRTSQQGGSLQTVLIDSTERFDPSAGQFAPSGALAHGRTGHTASLLPSGHVLVVGGVAGTGAYLNTVERYDPVTQRWAQVATLRDARAGHAAVVLPDGRVLVVGGQRKDGWLASVEWYDPEKDGWVA